MTEKILRQLAQGILDALDAQEENKFLHRRIAELEAEADEKLRQELAHNESMFFKLGELAVDHAVTKRPGQPVFSKEQ